MLLYELILHGGQQTTQSISLCTYSTSDGQTRFRGVSSLQSRRPRQGKGHTVALLLFLGDNHTTIVVFLVHSCGYFNLRFKEERFKEKREMKILKKFISHKSAEGSVTLQAEEDDEMYHLYNLIFEGDLVEAITLRNVSDILILVMNTS